MFHGIASFFGVVITINHGIPEAYPVRALDQVVRFRSYPRAMRTGNGPASTRRALIAWSQAQQHGIAHLLVELGRSMQNGHL